MLNSHVSYLSFASEWGEWGSGTAAGAQGRSCGAEGKGLGCGPEALGWKGDISFRGKTKRENSASARLGMLLLFRLEQRITHT